MSPIVSFALNLAAFIFIAAVAIMVFLFGMGVMAGINAYQ